ncbi:MAG: DNA polymerase III subunit alpha [Candidatus Izemoplasmatales bacterium]
MHAFDLFIQTGYSFNGSLVDVDRLVERAKGAGFTALGIADDRNMFAALKFYRKCVDSGIKPIIGMAFPTIAGEGTELPFSAFAKNAEGYRNLIRLASRLGTGEKNLGLEVLAQHASGLFFVSPTAHGALSDLIAQGDLPQAIDLWRTVVRTLPDAWLGLDLNDFQSELKIAPALGEVGRPVAFNRVRYMDRDDIPASRILQAILSDQKVLNEGLFLSEDAVYDFKTPERLERLFADYPAAVENAVGLIDSVELSIDFRSRRLPRYPLGPGLTAAGELRRMAEKGLARRLATTPPDRLRHSAEEYRKRLDWELATIETMGYSDYFLVVWDFVLHAKKKGILVGPGRGSAAGSLTSYVLGIVDVDPLLHNLFFERFLNPERITMPDIDMDFPDDRRDEVIRYVADKYGKEHVANIVAFGTFQGKSAIREVARILKTPEAVVGELAGSVSETANSIAEFKAKEPEKYRYLSANPIVSDLLSTAEKLVDLPKHLSTHAAGIVITDEPITDFAPVRAGLLDMNQTQYEASDLEAIGLLKIDFLGISNLTSIDRVLRLVEAETGTKPDIYRIPMDDPKTFRLLQDVSVLGVFQLESDGMMNLLRQMQVKNFDDISAAIALFRPGPMANIPTYLERRGGKAKVTYPDPLLEDILKDTYGIIVYQEQIMQIANQYAGYSLGEADVLRRAVSKKKEDVLVREREKFVRKCVERNHAPAVADGIYDYIVRFADYGFNKSHSVAYALVAYWMAYLKANHPFEFMAVLLDAAVGSAAATHDYVRECRKLGIRVLPPDINRSGARFRIEKEGLRLPFQGIRGIGPVIAKKIEEVRGDEPFADFIDFMRRAGDVNAKAVESLIMVGAFDAFGKNRATLAANQKQIANYMSFGEYSDTTRFVYIDAPEYDYATLQEKEKELLGINLTHHPLNRHQERLEALGIGTVSDALHAAGGPARFAGMVARINRIKTKGGEAMAFVEIEDQLTSAEGVLFPRTFARAQAKLEKGAVLIFTGRLETKNDKKQFVIDDVKDVG